MQKIRLFELFSGIGANTKALNRLGVDVELVGFSEIDKYAIQSFCAIHGVDKSLNYGDVSKIDATILPNFDLLTWGFPMPRHFDSRKSKGHY